ncbi:hypothetical protein PC9H_011733 [Pleurotus ostreatus]|uniref:NADH:flavin oxidoreductase/NADH oxidase N-terminal domain-containing protein n=1 Tax=Pleurotus ostreatus TaxID=5322 RepID=A0A8H7DQU2_PLEOS|nr:uncharacterized protein PC9H_011733 [Pleurotus ostreatus]KAF7421212.1 hypothetical protein PC9H_011733 [Pleurotus ostreatus]
MTPAQSIPSLFHPIKVGRLTLQHRVVLCPLTRCRATKSEQMPILPIVRDYYAQRASAPGTLLITEGTIIAPEAGGLDNVPGIWSDEQIGAWKQITDAVHAQGSHIYMQLWALGRCANPSILNAQNTPYVSASDIPLRASPSAIPRPLTVAEIEELAQSFGRAASNAINKAGFDGVEVHGASGYLMDQFLQDTSNKRKDEYGGSVEGRTRFALEVLEAVTREVGQDRTAIRISPWSKFNDMRMEDPKPTFSYLVTQIRERFPNLSYVHVVEPRVADMNIRKDSDLSEDEENDFLRKIWAPRPFIVAGGYTRELALKGAEKGDIIASGRLFLSNPDLVLRWRKDLPLNAYDRSTFYAHGDASEKGYVDYPFASE